MKSMFFRFNVLVFFGLIGGLVSGCLLKSSTVPIRHFVLTPISTNAPASAEHLSVEIGFVKMPAYLLRSSMALRTGANEIEYLEDAQWAERLDQAFQRTLAANLSRLLLVETNHAAGARRDRPLARVSVNVQQFDVDARGQGGLIAQWRLSAADADAPSKSGEAKVLRAGPSPHGIPEVIAATLSELVTEFSKTLARPIRESLPPTT